MANENTEQPQIKKGTRLDFSQRVIVGVKPITDQMIYGSQVVQPTSVVQSSAIVQPTSATTTQNEKGDD